MTALATSPNTRTARVRVPFFWWLHESRVDRATATADSGSVYLDASYIPTGTADLWRSARRRPGR
jgi:hypothetical protein